MFENAPAPGLPSGTPNPSNLIDSLLKRRETAQALLRLNVEDMTENELDLAIALLREKPIVFTSVGLPVFVLDISGATRLYSPTRNWDDFGEVMSNVGLVTGSHESEDEDPGNPGTVVTKYWYSCHAFFSGTRFEGWNLRVTVAQSCAKLLEHKVRFSESWQPPT